MASGNGYCTPYRTRKQGAFVQEPANHPSDEHGPASRKLAKSNQLTEMDSPRALEHTPQLSHTQANTRVASMHTRS